MPQIHVLGRTRWRGEVLAEGQIPRGRARDFGSVASRATCSEQSGQVQGKSILRAQRSWATEPQVPIFDSFPPTSPTQQSGPGR